MQLIDMVWGLFIVVVGLVLADYYLIRRSTMRAFRTVMKQPEMKELIDKVKPLINIIGKKENKVKLERLINDFKGLDVKKINEVIGLIYDLLKKKGLNTTKDKKKWE